jgi:hypothetical protein
LHPILHRSGRQLRTVCLGFLGRRAFTIENLFEIDNDYRTMIESLREAMRPDMNGAAFQARCNLRFIINDTRGQEQITLANCSEFISLANEFRLGQMRPWLEATRNGLWENLNFKPPVFITGDMIEHSACGSKEISFRKLFDL